VQKSRFSNNALMRSHEAFVTVSFFAYAT